MIIICYFFVLVSYLLLFIRNYLGCGLNFLCILAILSIKGIPSKTIFLYLAFYLSLILISYFLDTYAQKKYGPIFLKDVLLGGAGLYILFGILFRSLLANGLLLSPIFYPYIKKYALVGMRGIIVSVLGTGLRFFGAIIFSIGTFIIT